MLQGWMFGIEPVPAAAQRSERDLGAIPEGAEEGRAELPPLPSAPAHVVGCGLAFLLALETNDFALHNLPAGAPHVSHPPPSVPALHACTVSSVRSVSCHNDAQDACLLRNASGDFCVCLGPHCNGRARVQLRVCASGPRLKGLMDLVFAPERPGGGRSEESDALWLDPLARWAAAALLHSCCRHMLDDRWHMPTCRYASLTLCFCMRHALAFPRFCEPAEARTVACMAFLQEGCKERLSSSCCRIPSAMRCRTSTVEKKRLHLYNTELGGKCVFGQVCGRRHGGRRCPLGCPFCHGLLRRCPLRLRHRSAAAASHAPRRPGHSRALWHCTDKVPWHSPLAGHACAVFLQGCSCSVEAPHLEESREPGC